MHSWCTVDLPYALKKGFIPHSYFFLSSSKVHHVQLISHFRYAPGFVLGTKVDDVTMTTWPSVPRPTCVTFLVKVPPASRSEAPPCAPHFFPRGLRSDAALHSVGRRHCRLAQVPSRNTTEISTWIGRVNSPLFRRHKPYSVKPSTGKNYLVYIWVCIVVFLVYRKLWLGETRHTRLFAKPGRGST